MNACLPEKVAEPSYTRVSCVLRYITGWMRTAWPVNISIESE